MSKSAATIVLFGLGSRVPAGTKPTVISWSSLNRSVPGFPWTLTGLPFAAKAFFQ